MSRTLEPARCETTQMPPVPPIRRNGSSRLSSPAYSARPPSSTIARAWSRSGIACLTATTFGIPASRASTRGSRLSTTRLGMLYAITGRPSAASAMAEKWATIPSSGGLL